MIFTGLGLTLEEAPQLSDNSDAMKKMFSEIFAGKTQQEWCKIFDHVDACVAPVVPLDHAAEYAHNKDRSSFIKVR